MSISLGIRDVLGVPCPVFADEPPQRRSLLAMFIMDIDGDEQACLAEIAKAQRGQPEVEVWNNHVNVEMHANGRVIIEELRYDAADEAQRGPSPSTETTLTELRQLVLDWIHAKKRWQMEKELASEAKSSAAEPISMLTPQSKPN